MVFSSLMARLVELRGRPLTRRLNCSAMRLSSLTAFFLAGVVLLQPASAALPRSTPHERLPSELLPPHEPAEQPDDNLRATTFTPDSAARDIQRIAGGRVLAVQPGGAGYRVKKPNDRAGRI